MLSIEQLPDGLRSDIRNLTLKSGQILFYQEDPVDAIFFLKSGLVRLLHYTEGGEEVNHYLVHAGEFFAEVALVLDRYACTAVVDTTSHICLLPKQKVLQLMQQDSNFALMLTGQVAHHLHMTKILLEIRGIRRARDRVLRYLQNIAPVRGETFQIDQTFKTISQELNLTPETLSRALSQLEEEGIIERRHRQIILNHHPAFRLRRNGYYNQTYKSS